MFEDIYLCIIYKLYNKFTINNKNKKDNYDQYVKCEICDYKKTIFKLLTK